MSTLKRSSAVPLSLVPALAALVGCGESDKALAAKADPCLPAQYQQQICEQAVNQRGYYYGGGWYPHVYAYPPLFYYNGYSRYVGAGGRMRVMNPSVYTPAVGGARGVPGSRTTIVRSGFGGIGGSRGFAGG